MYEWEPIQVAKLLIHRDDGGSADLTRFVIEQCGVLVTGMTRLSQNDLLASVKYSGTDQLDFLIRTVKTMKIRRVFKSAVYFKDPMATMSKADPPRPLVSGMIGGSLANFFGLIDGATIRIMSDSKDLRDLAYKQAVELAESMKDEMVLGVKFDFDVYDCGLVFKLYHRGPMRIGKKQLPERWFLVCYPDRNITHLISKLDSVATDTILSKCDDWFPEIPAVGSIPIMTTPFFVGGVN